MKIALDRFQGVKIMMYRSLMSNINPRTLKEFCENEASYLTGFEKWIEKKVGFNVEIFTIIQKRFLKCKHKEKYFNMNGVIIVGPRTYEEINKVLTA